MMSPEDKDKLYTLRWHVRQLTPASRDAALGILGDLLGESSQAPSQPATTPSPVAGKTGEKLLRVPFAKQYGKESHTRGKYSNGYPVGAIVHFTAGSQNQKGEDAMDYQVKKGCTYFFIDKDGQIWQNFPLNEHGYHSGESGWKGLNGYVSDELVGIEIACAGQLDSKNKSWFGATIPQDQVRKVPGLANMEEGNYQKYTPAQEASLIRLLLWLKSNNPEVFNLDYVLGHDEVSGPAGIGFRRKNDPGGSLSCTMPQLRDKLKEQSK